MKCKTAMESYNTAFLNNSFTVNEISNSQFRQTDDKLS